MSRYRFYKPAVTQSGMIITNGTVTVYEGASTTTATIYESESGSVISGGQLQTDSVNGMIDFWVDEADYNGDDGFSCIITNPNGISNRLPWSGSSIGLRRGVIQRQYVIDSAIASGTTVLPADGTIPQSDEGIEAFTKTITPVNASNILEIRAAVVMSSSVQTTVSGVLFKDSVADGIAGVSKYQGTADGMCTLNFTHTMVAGGVSEITFKVRYGGNDAGTSTLNGSGAVNIFGGILSSHMVITESTP